VAFPIHVAPGQIDPQPSDMHWPGFCWQVAPQAPHELVNWPIENENTQAPVPQSAHAWPPEPHAFLSPPLTHCPSAEQQPSGHVSGPQVTQPLATLALLVRQNVPAAQVPEQTEPQPSDAPHALPSQCGTQSAHDPLLQMLPCPVQSTQEAPNLPQAGSCSVVMQ
jgi:hypothetical protein